MAKNNFIDAESVVIKLTEAFIKHEKAIEQSADALNKLEKEYSKLPSDYIKAQKEILDLNIKRSRAEKEVQNALNAKSRAEAAATRTTEVNRKAIEAQNKASEAAVAKKIKESSAYMQLSKAQAESARRVQDLIARGRQATQTQKQYDDELRRAQREFTALNQRVLKADTAVGKFNRNVGNYPTKAVSGIKDLIGAFGLVGGVTAIAMIGRDIFNTTKELQSLDLALKQVTGTNELFAESQSFLARVSEDYGIEINGLTKQFTQFYVSAKDKLSGKEIQGIFESIAKSAGFMGLSMEAQDRAFNALNQMMSKGTVTAEELKGQLGEALPGAFGIMAKALGTTEQGLSKLMQDGKILASDVLPKFAKEVEKAYGIENKNRVESLAASQTRLSNAWTGFIRELTEGESVITRVFSGFVDWIGKAVQGLTLLMETEDKRKKRFLDNIEQNAYKETLASYDKLTKAEQKLQATYSREQVIKDIKETVAENEKLVAQAKEIEKRRNAITTGVGRELLSTELEKFNEKIRENNESISFNNGLIKAYNEILTESNKKTNENTSAKTKNTKAVKDNYDEIARLYELEKLRIESQQRLLEREFDNERLYDIERIQLAKEISEERLKLANLTLKESLRLAKGNLIEEQIAYENYYKELETVTIEEENKILEIKKSAFEKFNEFRKTFGKLVTDETGIGDTRTLPTEELDQMVNAWEEYSKNVDKSAESTENLKKATNDWLQGFIDEFAGDTGFVTTFEIMQGKVAEFGKDWETTIVGIMEITQEVMNFIDQISENNYQREIMRLERQKEIAVQFAGESATARQAIDEQYESRKLQLERQRAKQQKQMAIFNAVINTAQAVVAALNTAPPASFIFAALAGAIGAAQIAMIASQPLPQFYKGTDNAPEGWAWTQEKGAEIITDKKGKVKTMGNSKGAQLTYLEKGDKVFTAQKSQDLFNDELNRSLMFNGILPSVVVNNDNSGIREEIQELGKIIKNRESITIIKDVKGERIYQKQQGNRNQILNNRLRIKGYDI